MPVISDRRFVYSCLALFAVLSFGSALQDSPTIDEPLQLISGYLYWRTGHYVSNPVDPPLIPLWTSLPLLTLHLPEPLPVPSWVFQNKVSLSSYFLYHSPISPVVMINAGRTMVIILGLLLGFLVWRWSSRLFGKFAGRASLAAYVFCPPILAFSHVVTSDLAVAMGSFSCLYAFWNQRQTRRLDHSFLFGLLLGMTLMIKFSGLLLIPILMVIAIADRPHRIGSGPHEASWLSQVSVILAGMSLPILMAFGRIGIGALLNQLTLLYNIMGQTTTVYFSGTIYQGDRAWFPSLCVLLKTPIPFLILAMASVWRAVCSKGHHKRFLLVWIALPASLYMLMLSYSSHFIGIRRTLLIYPLGCMAIGALFADVERMSMMIKRVSMMLCLWYVGLTIYYFPRYLSYFNELAGGPARGYHYLLDCNSDWGQGLKALGDYLRKENVSAIYLSYFGSIPPQVYGIRFISVGPFIEQNMRFAEEPALQLQREPKILFAISATNLMGVPTGNPSLYSWLKTRTPAATIRDSILVYDVTQDADARARLDSMRSSAVIFKGGSSRPA